MVLVLGLFEFTPLWKKQKEEELNVAFSFIIGMFGLIISFFSIQSLIIAKYILLLIPSLDAVDNSKFIELMSNFFIITVIGIFISLLINLLIKNQIQFTKDTDIMQEKENIIELIENEFIENAQKSFYQYVAIILLYGYLAGIYYAILYFVPLFFIMHFIFFIFLQSIPVIPNFVLSFIITWTILFIIFIRRKSELEPIQLPEVNYHQDFQFSKRTSAILASGSEPIICDDCKSYIAADSIKCQVCGVKIQ